MIHKVGVSSRFIRSLTAVLFLAVCAYLGAALFDGRMYSKSVVSAYDISAGSIELSGIAIRSEQCLGSSRSAAQTAQEGLRIPCGGRIAVFDDGEEILAPCSAFFFPDTDGYESLSPGMLQDLSVERLEVFLNFPADSSITIGRIVYDSVWYYAALSDSHASLSENTRCLLLFDGMEKYIPARLISISEASSGKRALVFRLNSSGDCLKLRHVSAKAVFPDTVV